MELKQIKELMTAMEKAGVKRLRIKDDQYELELERPCESSTQAGSHPPQLEVHPRFISHPTPHQHHRFPHEESSKPQEKKEEGKYITSPMVGTFYSASSPDDPPFVKVGDKVGENTVVCIVEAMKVMNEVKAGTSGTIAEILTLNAHPVEFGTKMFRIV